MSYGSPTGELVPVTPLAFSLSLHGTPSDARPPAPVLNVCPMS